ncbi:MAG: 2-C-methyl-D-erythritol 4-phosphate cytidylyltransferase [Bacteroidia bacterium]|nr:2-C-methyl-D-erythritol 4-phosphate cytidylyltransferase [Bacteroidia bacterium]
MKRYALIVAGGKGLRMQSELPKQFIPLNGLPVLMHTLNAFNHISNVCILLVLPVAQFNFWKQLCVQHKFNLVHQLVAGGQTRFHSVSNGLNAIDDTDSLVAIHDGVRPLIDPGIIEAGYVMAEEKGNAVAVVRLKDSIRKVELLGNHSVNRNNYYLVQTPQTFHTKNIQAAYANANHFNFTDDAGVIDEAGGKINLLEGDYKNIKITSPEDLIIAKVFLGSE